MFGLPEVQQACWDFALGCTARTDNFEDLMAASRFYINHKQTALLFQTVNVHTI